MDDHDDWFLDYLDDVVFNEDDGGGPGFAGWNRSDDFWPVLLVVVIIIGACLCGILAAPY